VDHLVAGGQLRPGWSGPCQVTLGNPKAGTGGRGPGRNPKAGNAVAVGVINLRAEVGLLILSWQRFSQTVPIVRVFFPRSRNSRTYFVCPGPGAKAEAEVELGADELGADELGADEVVNETTNEAASEATEDNPDTGAKPGAKPGAKAAGCGRRVLKLYFSHNRFLCRHCSGLVYACQDDRPGQRALRRANRLWRRLDATGADIDAGALSRLLAEAMQAEARATEAQTARIQRLIAWLDNRRGPQFTL
jgi:hypothetical protein